MYAIENYQKQERFHKCYKEISRFLRNNADSGFNEHFHWGRLDWLMAPPCPDVEMLPKITVFKDSGGTIVGTALFDTEYENGWYVLHSVSDEKLLRQMTAYINDVDSAPPIKANLNDIALCKLLEEMNFKKQFSEYVLAVNLSHDLSYRLPTGFCINEQNAPIDEWQWRLVIHRGFDHDGIPQTLSGEAAEAEKHLQTKEYIKTFAIKNGEYAAHCGLWYNGGETAYIEPVATVPEYRRKGLGKAVVYEALRRAKNQGARGEIESHWVDQKTARYRSGCFLYKISERQTLQKGLTNTVSNFLTAIVIIGIAAQLILQARINCFWVVFKKIFRIADLRKGKAGDGRDRIAA